MINFPKWNPDIETWEEWNARYAVQREQRMVEAIAAMAKRPLRIDLAVGVGTFDGNGNQKGSGW